MPDIGVATYSEMVESARSCTEAVSIPVIGDGDTGYGGLLNVRRTIQGYARAGLAAISIEDQTFPKRCSYAHGAGVVTFDESLERIRAAIQARDELASAEGREILIIARTDFLRCASGGDRTDEALQEAVKRCQAFEASGADVVYAEGLTHPAAMRAITSAVRVPTMLAQVEPSSGGGAPLLTTNEAAALGFRLLLRGVTLLNSYVAATRRTLRALRDGPAAAAAAGTVAGGAGGLPPDLLPFDDLCAAVGFGEAYAWERAAAAAAPATAEATGAPSPASAPAAGNAQ
jgi:2-methylisocitrate lyase-like PEP mutase family enzyme